MGLHDATVSGQAATGWDLPENEGLAKENEQLKAALQEKDGEIADLKKREVKLSLGLQRAEHYWPWP